MSSQFFLGKSRDNARSSFVWADRNGLATDMRGGFGHKKLERWIIPGWEEMLAISLKDPSASL